MEASADTVTAERAPSPWPRAASQSPNRITIAEAWAKFVARKEGQRLSPSWLYKFKHLEKQVLAFGRERGLTYLDQLDGDELTAFRNGWEVAAVTASKRQERLHAFFSWCLQREWLPRNPVAELGRIQVRPTPTDYFSREEFDRLLAVTRSLPLAEESRSSCASAGIVAAHAPLRISSE
jgi:site-specific recombinase XerD